MSALLDGLDAAGIKPGERFELAAIDLGRVSAGWFVRTAPELDEAARWLRRNYAANLYLLANPVHPAATRGGRAKAEQIAEARVLLLDLDPVKDKAEDPEGTQPEKLDAAREVAAQVRDYLVERLGVRPAMVDSGRGRQLWLRLEDCGDTPERGDVRKRLLRGLAAKFNRPGLVEVDLATSDPSRLCRLPGGRNSRTGRRAAVLDQGDGKSAAWSAVVALAEELEPKVENRPRPGLISGRPLPTVEWEGRPEDLAAALEWIPPDCGYETWLRVGMALHHSGGAGGFALWDAWSSRGEKYDGSHALERKWASFGGRAGVGLGTVFKLARDAGWRPAERPRPKLETLPVYDHAITPGTMERAEAAAEHLRVLSSQDETLADLRGTGSGKTYAAAEAALRVSRKVWWAAANHDLHSMESIPALEAAEARLQTGRTWAKLGKFAVLCGLPDAERERKVEERDALIRNGWNPTNAVCVPCPLFDDGTCPYWAQRKAAEAADVVLVQHGHLRYREFPEGAALVVDEDIVPTLAPEVAHTQANVAAFHNALANERPHLAGAVAGNLPPTRKGRRGPQETAEGRERGIEASRRELETLDRSVAALHAITAAMAQGPGWRRIEGLEPLGDTGGLEKSLAGKGLNMKNMFPVLHAVAGRSVAVRVGEGSIHVGLRYALPANAPALLLDATGDADMLRAATGRELTVIRAPAPAEVGGGVVQLTDAARGRRHFADEVESPRRLRRDAEYMAAFAAQYAHRARLGRDKRIRLGVISFKNQVLGASDEERAKQSGPLLRAVRKAWRPYRNRWLSLDVQVLYYGDLRGRNSLGDVDVGVVHGLHCLPPGSLQHLALVLNPDHALEPLNASTEDRWRTVAYRGTSTAAPIHASPELETAWRFKVEGETLQAIGRFHRGRSWPPGGVLVLSSSPFASTFPVRAGTPQSFQLDDPSRLWRTEALIEAAGGVPPTSDIRDRLGCSWGAAEAAKRQAYLRGRDSARVTSVQVHEPEPDTTEGLAPKTDFTVPIKNSRRREILRRQKLTLGLTQSALAERLGVPHGTLAGYLSGARPTPAQVLIATEALVREQQAELVPAPDPVEAPVVIPDMTPQESAEELAHVAPDDLADEALLFPYGISMASVHDEFVEQVRASRRWRKGDEWGHSYRVASHRAACALWHGANERVDPARWIWLLERAWFAALNIRREPDYEPLEAEVYWLHRLRVRLAILDHDPGPPPDVGPVEAGENRSADSADLSGEETSGDSPELLGEENPGDSPRFSGEDRSDDSSDLSGPGNSGDSPEFWDEDSSGDSPDLSGEKTSADSAGVLGPGNSVDSTEFWDEVNALLDLEANELEAA